MKDIPLLSRLSTFLTVNRIRFSLQVYHIGQLHVNKKNCSYNLL